ncbi:MAG: hypothetical protein AAF560_07660 [Acidobacteriota bacterium]
MPELNRRDAMIHLGLGTAGLLWTPRAVAVSPLRADPEALAAAFRSAPRRQVLEVAATAIRAGASHQHLLGAAFLAGVHDVRPRSVGGKLHCVMMIESAFQLAATAPPREAFLAALWSIDDFKNSQRRDINEREAEGEGDWVLPPRPVVDRMSEKQARRAFHAAMDAWDAEAADRAVVALLAHRDHAALFELLWPYAARCYVDLGHKIIFATQVERVIQRLGWQYAEPAVRSLVNGLLYRSDDISGSEPKAFERSRRLAASAVGDWRRGKEDPAASAQLLAELRSCDSAAAQRLVVDAFADGLGPATVWDGLRLYASELFHRRPASAARRHAPVHGVTEVNAFAYVWRTSRHPETQRLAILQAAAWLPFMRRDLKGFLGDYEGPGLDALGNDEAERIPSVSEVFEQRSPAAARVRLDREPSAATAYLAEMRRHLVQRAFQSHQFKYAAAIQEEAALAHPRWASRILAPAVTYLPTLADPDSAVLERSRHALRSAEIG